LWRTDLAALLQEANKEQHKQQFSHISALESHIEHEPIPHVEPHVAPALPRLFTQQLSQ
jgi:hypothetical protein